MNDVHKCILIACSLTVISVTATVLAVLGLGTSVFDSSDGTYNVCTYNYYILGVE